jgi:hypothetical protein
MMIMPVLPETKLSRNGPVGIGVCGRHCRVAGTGLDEIFVKLERLARRLAVEHRFAVGDEIAAIGDEQRGERVYDACRPGVDHAETLLAGIFLGQLGGGILEFVPGLGRRRNACLGKQCLVVVECVDIDLVGDAVKRTADACRRDDTLPARRLSPRLRPFRAQVPPACLVRVRAATDHRCRR